MQEVSHNMQTIADNKQSIVMSNRRSLNNINTSSHILNKYDVTFCVGLFSYIFYRIDLPCLFWPASRAFRTECFFE